MKSRDLVISSIYAHSKDSYDKGRAVLVLDTKNWSMGKEWVDGKKQYMIREATKGERPNGGTYRNDYRRVGIPVLKIEQDLFHWDASTNLNAKILDTHEEILARATKILGIEQASDAAGIREKDFSVHVPVTMGDGKKSVVTVALTTILPQTITGAWNTHLENRRKAEAARVSEMARLAEEKERRQAVDADVAARVTALLGDTQRNWRGERYDCAREGEKKHFQVSEGTLLKLLALAEQGSQL